MNAYSDKNYNWLTQNSKIKKSSGAKTYNWGIPAYKSANGFSTCPNAAACAKGCYATQGAYLFSNVAKVFEARLKLSLSPRFESIIIAEIQRRNIQRVRIHDSGDFYSLEYTEKWLRIIKAHPLTEFYAYTKMLSVFRRLDAAGRVPINLTLIYSYGGKEDKTINRETERHSWVFSSSKALREAGYADASKDDSVALGPNHKIGLIYHGTKNIENTDWSKVKAA